MATATKEPEVLEVEVAPQLSSNSANFDTQVATAKRYPRSIARFMQHAQEMAILTPEIAASCIYAIPRDGKMIEGPSARLAEIVAHAWGNLRIQASAGSDDDDRFIVGRGEAWDVETNVAIGYEVKRRITGRSGSKFNDDMIAVTGNAAASIALRNAVFKTVPSSFWKPIYFKCREVVAGKAETFHTRRDAMIKAFGVMGATPDQIIGLLNVRGVLDITLEHMVTLTGVYNSLKDGETTIEEAFASVQAPIKPAERKSAQTPPAPESSQAPAATNGAAVVGSASQQPAKEEARSGRETPSAASGTVGGPSTTAAPNVGVIKDLVVKGDALIAVLNTGHYAGTRDEAFKTTLRDLHQSQKLVELVPTTDSGSAKNLTEINPIAELELQS